MSDINKSHKLMESCIETAHLFLTNPIEKWTKLYFVTNCKQKAFEIEQNIQML